jgi:hypothetical protein
VTFADWTDFDLPPAQSQNQINRSCLEQSLSTKSLERYIKNILKYNKLYVEKNLIA